MSHIKQEAKHTPELSEADRKAIDDYLKTTTTETFDTDRRNAAEWGIRHARTEAEKKTPIDFLKRNGIIRDLDESNNFPVSSVHYLGLVNAMEEYAEYRIEQLQQEIEQLKECIEYWEGKSPFLTGGAEK